MTWALATIAALLIGYATVSRRLERLNVSGAMYFTTAGLLVGPVLGLLELQVHGEQVKLLAEITLTLVLFADASRISLRALHHEFAVPLRLLGIGLPLTIIAGARRERAGRQHLHRRVHGWLSVRRAATRQRR
jgi:NhaP-type Na+/H+ or K+/H+ antiporter